MAHIDEIHSHASNLIAGGASEADALAQAIDHAGIDAREYNRIADNVSRATERLTRAQDRLTEQRQKLSDYKSNFADKYGQIDQDHKEARALLSRAAEKARANVDVAAAYQKEASGKAKEATAAMHKADRDIRVASSPESAEHKAS